MTNLAKTQFFFYTDCWKKIYKIRNSRHRYDNERSCTNMSFKAYFSSYKFFSITSCCFFLRCRNILLWNNLLHNNKQVKIIERKMYTHRYLLRRSSSFSSKFPRWCLVDSCNSIRGRTKKDRLGFLSSDRDSVLEDKLRVGRVWIDNRARGVERVSRVKRLKIAPSGWH